MSTERTIKIIRDGENHWCIRLLTEGETMFLGKVNNLSIQEIGEGAVVQFYDCDYEHTDLGQFAASYDAGNFLKWSADKGLSLNDGVPKWEISADGIKKVRTWLTQILT
jgi:hypothetical protein